MKGKLIWSIFWALVGIFVVIASVFAIPAVRELLMGFLFIIISGAAFFLLGVALIFFTVKGEVGGMLKKFLILTGASSTGFFVSLLLHYAFYVLFVYFLGEGVWDRTGIRDDPFFFIMAIVVCPLGFLIGAIGSIVLASKRLR